MAGTGGSRNSLELRHIPTFPGWISQGSASSHEILRGSRVNTFLKTQRVGRKIRISGRSNTSSFNLDLCFWDRHKELVEMVFSHKINKIKVKSCTF